MRNTPASAGKTSENIKKSRPVKKHPRVRGEDEIAFAEKAAKKETPPRPRGRRAYVLLPGDRQGNTPASAGKTNNQPSFTRKRKKHPRVRGEDHRDLPMIFPARETPPRPRGRHGSDTGKLPPLRNTPASAGKTVFAPGSAVGLWKHPRVRGEDLIQDRTVFSETETPPRPRGRRLSGPDTTFGARNTPASAGKTD